MEKCVESLDSDALKQLCGQFEDAGRTKEQIRASVERSLTTRAFQIGPSAAVDEVDRFLQFVIGLAKEGRCGVSFTVQILQDMFDVSTTKRCEELFAIVEQNIAVFKTDFFFTACKNLILRMCNDLLKRLSRTVNTEFCGRIIVLLAKSLPLNERSGLNLPGHYNTDNITVYDTNENRMDVDQSMSDDQLADGVAEAADDVEEEDRDEGELHEKDLSVTVNYALYVKFWEIQAYFSNPNLLHVADAFQKFESNLSDVLTVFTTFKLERSGSSKSQNDDQRTPTLSNGFVERFSTADGVSNGATSTSFDHTSADQLNGVQLEDDFFAKYLTSQKLFKLQLADSQFRRYFLVQCLILMNCLSTKPRSKDNFAAIQDSFLNDVAEKCYVCLRDTYPHGSHFAESVKRILAREKLWIAWKSEGCVNIIEPRLGSKCLAYKKRPVDRLNPKAIDLSNTELTRLWNINPNNLAACAEEKRKCVPQLRKFLEDGLDEMDPEQQVDEQCRSVQNENYQWMASRFLLANSDNYLNIAALEAKAPCKPVGKFLEQAIHLTARNTPELTERADEIDRRIKEIEAAKEAEIIRQAEEEKERLMQEAAKAEARREAEQKAAAEKEKLAAADRERKEAEKLTTEKARKPDDKPKSKRHTLDAERAAKREESERMKREELAMKARLEQKVENAQKRKAAKDAAADGEIVAGAASTDKSRPPSKDSKSRTAPKENEQNGGKSLKEDDKSSTRREDSKTSTRREEDKTSARRDDDKSTTRRTTASRRAESAAKNGHETEPSTSGQAGDRKVNLNSSFSSKKRKAERIEKEKADPEAPSSRHVKVETAASPPQHKTPRRSSNSKRN